MLRDRVRDRAGDGLDRALVGLRLGRPVADEETVQELRDPVGAALTIQWTAPTITREKISSSFHFFFFAFNNPLLLLLRNRG